MNELWAFSCAESRNRIVNAISWNIINVVSVIVQDTKIYPLCKEKSENFISLKLSFADYYCYNLMLSYRSRPLSQVKIHRAQVLKNFKTRTYVLCGGVVVSPPVRECLFRIVIVHQYSLTRDEIVKPTDIIAIATC